MVDNSNEPATIAPIPAGWSRTQRPAIAQGGVVWRSYRTSINQYILAAEFAGALVTIRANPWPSTTYTARAVVSHDDNGRHLIGNRIRSEYHAFAAAAKWIGRHK